MAPKSLSLKRFQRRKARSGQCHICGCTHDRACASGCWWANAGWTICTQCVFRVSSLAALLIFARGERLTLGLLQEVIEEIIL